MRLNRSEEFLSSIYNFDYNLIDFVSDCAVTDTPRFPSASRIAISSTRGILIRFRKLARNGGCTHETDLWCPTWIPVSVNDDIVLQ
jgi:hypothetical protein